MATVSHNSTTILVSTSSIVSSGAAGLFCTLKYWAHFGGSRSNCLLLLRKNKSLEMQKKKHGYTAVSTSRPKAVACQGRLSWS